MSLEGAEAAFRHAATQDIEDAIAIILDGLIELTDEVRSLRAQIEQMKSAAGPR